MKRVKLDGNEEDAFHARRLYGWGRGTLRAIKRRYHKKERAAGKRSTWEPVE